MAQNATREVNIILRRGEVGGVGERIIALIADYMSGNMWEEIRIGLRIFGLGGSNMGGPKGREVN